LRVEGERGEGGGRRERGFMALSFRERERQREIEVKGRGNRFCLAMRWECCWAIGERSVVLGYKTQ